MKGKQILGQAEADNLAFDYIPKQFPIKIHDSATNFVSSQQELSSDFEISELIAEQSGIADINRKEVEIKVEAEALDKLKEVQERAYSEAYDLGLIEGTEKAYKDNSADLRDRVLKLDELIKTIEVIQVDLVEKSELQILKLLNMMASKIAMDHVEANKEIVLEVIKKVIEAAQSDEEVILKVSTEDRFFISSVRERSDLKLDYLDRVKLEPDDDIKSGGCILETRYGAIDATLEQRLNKVWESIEGKMPRVKDLDEEEEPPEGVEASPLAEVDEVPVESEVQEAAKGESADSDGEQPEADSDHSESSNLDDKAGSDSDEGDSE